MKLKKIIIKNKDGQKFSKLSKDFNKIHINKQYGYNSIFGDNIVHGVFAIISFFNTIKPYQKAEYFDLKVNFLYPIFYNKGIFLKKKKHNSNEIQYSLVQNKKETVDIVLKNIHKLNNLKKNNIKFLNKDLVKILYKISHYAGMVYPGENSLIRNINISKSKDIFKSGKSMKIKSKLLDRRLPIINNNFHFKNYIINFQTIKRPHVNLTRTKLNNYAVKRIKNLKNNVLIVGASQGIGRDFLEILKKNRKIKKIATYNRNKIKNLRKDVIVRKIDLLNDKGKVDLNKIISKYEPIKIFYFSTPKILFDKKVDSKKEKEFKNFYINMPLMILNKNKNKNISFFYPSTKYIEFEKNSSYSKIKYLGEKKIKDFCYKNEISLSIHRFPAINSRQSISISNPNNPNLNEYLNGNKKYINKILLN